MLRRCIPSTALLGLVATSGCQNDLRNAEPPCRDLVAAMPAEWPGHWQTVHARGTAVAPVLVDALRANPEGPGAQAAIHLLGTLGNAAARTFLEEVLGEGTSLSAEAALALGRLGDPASVPALRAVVDARDKHVTTRVAAAAALVALDRGSEIVGFLEAVFLAATPYAAGSTRKHGLPRQKTRWAHERYMLIEALRARYDGATFGLDEDASWPALRDGAARLRAFLTR